MKKNLRIYTDQKLQKGFFTLDKKKSHYLKNVMRMDIGDYINIFNENDGEWIAKIDSFKKNQSIVSVEEFYRSSSNFYDICLLFAPIKQARLDYMAQKTCEMGVKTLLPIFTDYTQSKKINSDRFRSNLIEAAEQCDFNCIPELMEPENFDNILINWDSFFKDRNVIFCDENSTSNAFSLLKNHNNKEKKWSIIVGPEGGFSEKERKLINQKDNSFNLSLGPRILRSDTAAIAVLSIFQMLIGDWNN